ncbi:uncharacterized protein LOC144438842 [Glandiceps talaboti]
MVSWISHFSYPYEINPGDHIYVYRVGFMRPHHGILLGDHSNDGNLSVIHFVRDYDVTANQLKGKVVKSSLDDFRQNDFGKTASIRRYRYGVSSWERRIKRRGTCTTRTPDDTEVVLRRTWNCHDGVLPDFDISSSEEFALYCTLGNDFKKL